MKKKGKEKREKKIFWFSLGISLFLFLTAAGLLTVDCRGRSLSFGDNTPPFSAVRTIDGGTDLKIRLLGVDTSVDITEIYKFWNFLLDFSCIPHK